MGLAIGWPSPGARSVGGAMITALDEGLGESWLGRDSGVVLCERGDDFLVPGARASRTAGDSISSSTVTLGALRRGISTPSKRIFFPWTDLPCLSRLGSSPMH
jgi:hypothetical protein